MSSDNWAASRMKPVMRSAVLGAVIYALAFWARDAINCLAATSGCQVRGEISPMLIVLVGFAVAVALALLGYFLVIRRFARSVGGHQQLVVRGLVLVTALVYSLAFGLGALGLL